MKNISWELYCKMGLAKLEKRIQQFEIEHKGICIFGHEEYNCPYIGRDYCVNGKHKECPHYQEQLEKLR